MQQAMRGTPAASAAERQDRAVPWPEVADGWTQSERTEYERARRQSGSTLLMTARAPALLRESLMSLADGAGADDEVRRELSRVPAPDAG